MAGGFWKVVALGEAGKTKYNLLLIKGLNCQKRSPLGGVAVILWLQCSMAPFALVIGLCVDQKDGIEVDNRQHHNAAPFLLV